MVVGVLLAVTAGMLALELARILAFLTGGVAAWAGAQTVLPQAQELWAVFLSGGLLGRGAAPALDHADDQPGRGTHHLAHRPCSWPTPT